MTVFYVYMTGVTLHLSGRCCVQWKDGCEQCTGDRTFFTDSNQIIRNRLISKHHFVHLTNVVTKTISLIDRSITRSPLSRYGPRSFAVSGPAAWNSLPTDVQDLSLSHPSFCSRFKTELFNEAYGVNLSQPGALVQQ